VIGMADDSLELIDQQTMPLSFGYLEGGARLRLSCTAHFFHDQRVQPRSGVDSIRPKRRVARCFSSSGRTAKQAA
jgi:hypothetical protein